MNVLVLTRYSRNGASSRLRFYQYIPYLQECGFSFTISPLFDEAYIKQLNKGEPKNKLHIFWLYIRRLKTLFSAKRYDLLWIEKELFPYIPPFFEYILGKLRIAYVVDYDDATFHLYDQHRLLSVRAFLGSKIKFVMRSSGKVIAGNQYLYSYAKNAGVKKANLECIPTVIDTDLYYEKKVLSDSRKKIRIGWIGSPTTGKYLEMIEEALYDVSAKTGCVITIIGAKPNFNLLNDWDFIEWNEESEIQDISTFNIGIMPLTNDPWSKGKCGYKLIQYMGCALPVVASPVGLNKKIVHHGENGFLAASIDEWKKYLFRLATDEELRKQLGKNGRQFVEKKYSLISAKQTLRKILEEAVNHNRDKMSSG